jgi:hypothetical protein
LQHSNRVRRKKRRSARTSRWAPHLQQNNRPPQTPPPSAAASSRRPPCTAPESSALGRTRTPCICTGNGAGEINASSRDGGRHRHERQYGSKATAMSRTGIPERGSAGRGEEADLVVVAAHERVCRSVLGGGHPRRAEHRLQPPSPPLGACSQPPASSRLDTALHAAAGSRIQSRGREEKRKWGRRGGCNWRGEEERGASPGLGISFDLDSLTSGG